MSTSPAKGQIGSGYLTVADMDEAQRGVSIVIPIYNEEENILPGYAELKEVMDGTSLDYEVVFVDDGSRDGSLRLLKEIAASDPRVVVVEFRRNFGQTAAMAAGFDHAAGRVIVPMDGDMQNDPRDIPMLLERLDEAPGYDVISGWRRQRQDAFANRKLPSRIANWIIGRVTGVRLHDYGCSLKAYRREILRDVQLYSEMHRFLPALAAWNGARVGEAVVNHRPRTRGETKYGLSRTFKVLLDLVTVKFLASYVTKPLYLFGKWAAYCFGIALVLLFISIGQKYGYFGQPEGLHLNRNVLVTLATLMAMLSAQCIVVGIVSELVVRIYHESVGRPIYRVRNIHRSEAVARERSSQTA